MSASRHRRNERRDRRAHVRALARPNLPSFLMEVLDYARSVWEDFCLVFHTPAQLAERAYITRANHAEMRDWIYHLELLMRRFIFAAASMLNIVLRPVPVSIAGKRARRRILLWPHSPHRWPTRFSMRTSKGARETIPSDTPKRGPRVLSAFPLALRLEGLRRIILDPTARIHRHAIRLARIAARNARANAPRRICIRYWDFDRRLPTRGQRLIAAPMRIVQPLACNAADDWNEAAEPD